MDCSAPSKALVQNHTCPPKLYGRRLLPQVLDEHSESNPQRLYASIPQGVSLSQGFCNVTCREMADAVNGFTHWIKHKVGCSELFETLAYIGISDLRTAIVFLAAVKTGHKVLLLSPRNPLVATLSLLEQTKCAKLLYTSEMAPLAKSLGPEKPSLQSVEVPSFDQMLLLSPKLYPYPYTFEEAIRNPILILHSSGSTGLPKPILMTHGTFATMDNDRNLPKVDGRKGLDFTIWDFSGSGIYYTAFPPFHLAGFVATILVPIFSEAGAPVLGPAHRPATGALVHEIMQQHHLKALFVPPSIIEQLLQEPGGQQNFQKLEWIAYTGGPLSPSAGDLLSKFVDICPFFGVTETLPLQQLVPLREDWSYIEWHPCRKIELQPSEDDAYELVVFSDDSTERISGLNHNFPDTKEWRTKDLFKPHPKKPNLWRFHGRLDDIVVLSNGEKFNPVPIEALVQGHPVVMGALVVGQGKFQAALLVEPQPEISDRTTIAEVIWPIVERANRLVPSHGQITQSKIAVASIDKPFQRAGKGTVIRRLTERDYTAEIAALYESDGAIRQKATPILLASFALEEVERFVRRCTTSSFPDIEIADDDDLFVQGLDSLKTVNLAAMLKSGLRPPGSTSDLSWLSDKTLYSNPTIDGLSYLIYQSLNPEATSSADEARLSWTRQSRMAALVEQYTQDLPVLRPQPSPQPSSTPIVVALTGTTGSLGTHLFQALHSSPTISKIYCLNRADNAQNRHFAKLAGQGFKPGVSDFKAVYLTVNFSDPTFGLAPDTYAAMSSQVDVIVHNAWKVDFKHALSSYEGVHIRGLRHLISWSTNSARSPRIVFISSVSAAANWASVHKANNSHSTTTTTTTIAPLIPVPETPLLDYSAAAPMGYGESKHVAERILAAAHERSGVPISVLRIGQIAGSTSRADPSWPAQEWVPALVQTSKALRMVPGAGGGLPPVDWIPVNEVAAIVVEILLADRRGSGSGFYNLVHPRPVEWEAMIGPLREGLGPGVVGVEPLAEWIDRLAKFDGLNEAMRADKPALRLMDLFRGFAESKGDVVFETTRATGVSKTMAALEPISPALMKMWLEQWGF